MISFTDYMNAISFIDSLKEEEYSDFLDFLYESQEETLLERQLPSGNVDIQPWKSIRKDISPKEDLNVVAKPIYDTIIKDYIEPIKKEYERILKSSAEKDCKIMVSIKSLTSFISKLKRGKKFYAITDILRGAILCPNDEIVEKVIKNLKKKSRVAEFETKQRGENDWGYWGANHLLLELSNDVLAEVQVMTKTAWTYKDEAHKIYNKYRDALSKNKDILQNPEVQKDIKRSKMIFDKGFMGKKGIRF